MSTADLEKELQEARERLAELESRSTAFACPSDTTLEELIFEKAPGGMAIVTIDGHILACNSEAAKIIGYTPSELRDINVRDLIPNESDMRQLQHELKSGKTITGHSLRLTCKDSSTIWASFNGKPLHYADQNAALVTFSDVTKHKKALNELELDEIRFETLYTISGMIHQPESEILNFALDAIVKVSDSRVGYIFVVTNDESELKLHAWSDDVMPQCTVDHMPDIYMTADTGLWAEAIRKRQAVVTNDYANMPHKKGIPEGHVRIHRHLSIPVFEEDQVVYLAGVGNKTTDYTDEDIRQLQLVMDGTVSILQRKKAIQTLERAHEELEEKIQDRTAKLQQANEDFARLTAKLIRQDKERDRAQKKLIRYERIISSSPDLISLMDRNYTYKMVNDAYLTSFKVRREDILDKKAEEIIGKELFNKATKIGVDKAFTGETATIELWVDFPNKSTRFMAVTYHPVSIETNDIEFVSIEARDMTDLKRKEEALQEAADRLDLATDAGNIGIWEWDLTTDDTHWDKQMHFLYRVEPGKFDSTYDAWRTRVHDDDLPDVERVLADCIERKKRFDTEFRIVWPNDEIRFIKAAGSLRIAEDGTPHAMTGVNWDITDRRNMENELRRLASTDPLTGTSNRRHFMDRLEAEFERCKRYKTPMVLLSLDIDHFKKINDTFGHPAGDEVLKDLVQRCTTTLRTTDVFGRVGGEEFLAALTQTSLTAGLRTAERLRTIIEEHPVEVGEKTIPYTISIGLTGTTESDNTIESILKRADEALYKAKNNGRNRVEQV